MNAYELTNYVGCPVLVTFDPERVPRTSVTAEHKTPNRQMKTDGYARYPFESYIIQLSSTTIVSLKGTSASSTDAVVTPFKDLSGHPVVIDQGYDLPYPDRCTGMALYRYGNGYVWFDSTINVFRIVTRLDNVLIYRDATFPVDIRTEAERRMFLIRGQAPNVLPYWKYGSARQVAFESYPTLLPDSAVHAAIDLAVRSIVEPSPQLVSRLINSFKLTTVNIPAFFVDFPDLGKSTIDVLRSLTDIVHKTGKARSLAKANLAYQYGDRLTISDTRQIIEDVYTVIKSGGIFAPQKRSASESTTITNTNVYGSVKTTLNALASCNGSLERGTYLMANCFNLSNTWDMIPFSFVIDWFANISDLFEAADAATIESTLDFERILYSNIVQLSLTNYPLLDDTPVSGTIFYYYRQRLNAMPKPDALIQASVPTANQWINGASLLTTCNCKRLG